ncbi:hypothetical protein JTB14_014439 [Gonioctena quinquepunctata]|nr:hypothetical protein JTB14_014439 [Gonioctena quinquepunctata]
MQQYSKSDIINEWAPDFSMAGINETDLWNCGTESPSRRYNRRQQLTIKEYLSLEEGPNQCNCHKGTWIATTPALLPSSQNMFLNCF